MKSVIEIKDDLYAILKNSPLANEVTGKICKRGKRPKGSTLEDIVISVADNENGQIQNAIAYVNIYVKDDIMSNGQNEEPSIRLRKLCTLASELLDVGTGSNFRFTLESQNAPALEDTKEHVIINKLNIKIENEYG